MFAAGGVHGIQLEAVRGGPFKPRTDRVRPHLHGPAVLQRRQHPLFPAVARVRGARAGRSATELQRQAPALGQRRPPPSGEPLLVKWRGADPGLHVHRQRRTCYYPADVQQFLRRVEECDGLIEFSVKHFA